MFQETLEMSTKSSSPPWQVLDLVAHHLDPDSLAAASCVSKSWSASFSSDDLWRPLCAAAYPSLSILRTSAAAPPYRRLYSLGRIAEDRRRRKPPKPRLSLHDLLFSIEIQNRGERVAGVVVPGRDLRPDRHGIFRFDVEVREEKCWVEMEGLDEVRVMWNVVVEGYKGAFGMMDCEGKGNFVVGLEGWFSKELPAAAGCCWSGGVSGLVADLRLGLRGDGGGRRAAVEVVSVGVLSVVSWRYVGVEDALRYLQHFLLPSN